MPRSLGCTWVVSPTFGQSGEVEPRHRSAGICLRVSIALAGFGRNRAPSSFSAAKSDTSHPYPKSKTARQNSTNEEKSILFDFSSPSQARRGQASFERARKCNVSRRHLQNTFILGALHPSPPSPPPAPNAPVYFNNAVIFYYKAGFLFFFFFLFNSGWSRQPLQARVRALVTLVPAGCYF